jgi:hypothetical protein
MVRNTRVIYGLPQETSTGPPSTPDPEMPMQRMTDPWRTLQPPAPTLVYFYMPDFCWLAAPVFGAPDRLPLEKVED